MKTENLLLSACVAFIILVMTGLCVQSCRTKKIDNSYNRVSETAYDRAYESVMDTVSLSSLGKRWQDILTVNIKRYGYVRDVSGGVVPVLSEDITAVKDTKYSSDSSMFKKSYRDSSSVESAYRSEDQRLEIDEETSGANDILGKFFLIIVALILIYLVFRFRLRLEKWFH